MPQDKPFQLAVGRITIGVCQLLLAISVSAAPPSTTHAGPWDRLLAKSAELREQDRRETQQQWDQWNIQLDPWCCIGPFKDGLFVNVSDVFNKSYRPETDALLAGRSLPDLSMVYSVPQLPGMPSSQREWTSHPEWTDGYRHLLPRGPSPSRSEVVYLYRTIAADTDCSVPMRLYAEDHIRAWLNAQPLGEARRRYGPSRFPSDLTVTLPLQQGDNRLLIKIASIHAAHGFAFSLPDLTPGHALSPGQWSPAVRRSADDPTVFTSHDQPFISVGRTVPDESIPDSPDVCRTQIADLLAVPHCDVLDVTAELTSDQLQTLTRRARAYTGTLKRLEAYRGEMQMTPMFDPPKSAMYDLLATRMSASPAAVAYAEHRRDVYGRATAAMALADAGDPQAESVAQEAVDDIERLWRSELDCLPPILFLQRPSYQINAIAPYSIRGVRPSSICVFDPARPQAAPRVVFHDPDLAIYDMNLSWDAQTIFFSAHRGAHGCWQLYEIGIDGTNLKQITHNEDADFVSPCQLPSGDIAYVSTQANTWVQCQGRKAGLLYASRRDGSQPRKLSANIDSDHSPQVMNDGRILFTRWDYGIEKNVFARHALWTMNPDGTGFRLFFGNTIEDPAGFWKARPIPDSPAVVCVFGPHHQNQAGMLGMVWNQLGPEAPRGQGFRFITDEIPSYCDTNFQHGYQDPFPLHERLSLVSYGGDGNLKNRIYLIDDHGNKKCLFEASGELSCYYPIPLVARPKPPVRVPESQETQWVYRDPVEMNQQTPDDQWGTLLVQDGPGPRWRPPSTRFGPLRRTGARLAYWITNALSNPFGISIVSRAMGVLRRKRA